MAVKAAIGLVLVLTAASAWAQPSRFFFSGDGTIELRHGHFEERLAVRYRDGEGRYDRAAIARIRYFFRSREDGAAGDVSLRLIELIDFVEDRFRPSQIVLLSGYRSPEFNERLRGGGVRAAKASLHTEGLAADLHFAGVDLGKLWHRLRGLRTGGVGYYKDEGFLHLDTGQPRFWEPRTSRVEENLSAGNARLFARTGFDRYRKLDGVMVRVHNVTALPLRIARRALLDTHAVALEPVAGDCVLVDDCWVIDRPARAYEFRVRSGGVRLPNKRQATIRLATCPPRVEATPAHVETNPIEKIRYP